MARLKDSRILVLGASGFIGRQLCRGLAKAGAVVRGLSLDIAPAEAIPDGMPEDVEWIRGDYSDEVLVQEAVEGMDAVVHLACATLPASSNEDLRHDLASNVFPTLTLLDAAVRTRVKKVVFISSGGTVYGLQERSPVDEAHATDPVCGYGIHKLAIEKYLQLYRHHYGLNYVVLRVSNPYGAGQVSDRPQGVIGRFIYQALKERQIEIWGDGRTVRDYLYIDDLVEAFLAALQYVGRCHLFNVGSGVGHSLLDVIASIERVLCNRLRVIHTPGRTMDIPFNVLDVSRASSVLGWRPSTALQQGIELVCKLCRQGRATSGRPAGGGQ